MAEESLSDQITVILREISGKDDKVRLSKLKIVNNCYVFIFQGITSLLANGVYSAAYPLHDVSDLRIYCTCLLSDTKKSVMCYLLMASAQTRVFGSWLPAQLYRNCSNFCRLFPSLLSLMNSPLLSCLWCDHK